MLPNRRTALVPLTQQVLACGVAANKQNTNTEVARHNTATAKAAQQEADCPILVTMPGQQPQHTNKKASSTIQQQTHASCTHPHSSCTHTAHGQC